MRQSLVMTEQATSEIRWQKQKRNISSQTQQPDDTAMAR